VLSVHQDESAPFDAGDGGGLDSVDNDRLGRTLDLVVCNVAVGTGLVPISDLRFEASLPAHVGWETLPGICRTVGVTPVSFSAEVTVIHEEKSSTGVFDSYAITANQVSVSVSAAADHDFVQDAFRSTPVGQQWTVH
jgi:hypothetical protein